ncbi:TIGR03915 family putative DNA repair protein [Celeribacter litoreus]|uniref:TIGR03915 family putative DNA repair protein n=1 Tax=Celeribacter litoreus TaxID=2876714 RepID=UPI001CCC90E2|nr:TIGR03915 family putative DNA repair protein [Celeribacter litoreus]MCA0044627.1 TIGR03915 family putative DNA repair protein [Celeribacter litoreus]
MSYRITLPEMDTFTAWRDVARRLISANIPPEEVLWSRGAGEKDLFARPLPPLPKSTIPVPKSFVSLARLSIWHCDHTRFHQLYALLWALRSDRTLIEDRGDIRISRLNRMAKEVGRDRHKMHAFLRFREIGDPDAPRRRFAAWFEPSHYTLEPALPFFTDRFGDMDWSIFTPDLSAHFVDGKVQLAEGVDKPDFPIDATEDLWRVYFRNIFNPARVKLTAMTSEMPKKYWANMPEASEIPDLIATAEARVRAMADAAPTVAPKRAEVIKARGKTRDD